MHAFNNRNRNNDRYFWCTVKPMKLFLGDNMNLRRASLIVQLIKNPPAMQETPVQFLGWEDPLEKREATHSSILGFPL